MTDDELKKGIYQLVDSVHDDVTLIDLHRVVSLIVKKQGVLSDDDWLTQSSPHTDPRLDK